MGQRPRVRATLDELHSTTVDAPESFHRGYHDYLSANLAQDEGNTRTAYALYTQARSIAEAIGAPGLNVEVRLGMSRCERTAGHASSAQAWADDALAWANRVGYRHLQGRALLERGRVRPGQLATRPRPKPTGKPPSRS